MPPNVLAVWCRWRLPAGRQVASHCFCHERYKIATYFPIARGTPQPMHYTAG